MTFSAPIATLWAVKQLHKYPLLFLALFLVLFFIFYSKQGSASTPCPGECPPQNGYRIGAAFKILAPSQLPNFGNNLPTYGLFFSVPQGNNSIGIDGVLGTEKDFDLYLVDLNYRYLFPIPLFSMYGVIGTHFLHYESFGKPHDFFGGNVGFGFLLRTNQNMDLHAEMKVYFQEKPIVAFQGGMALIL